MSDPILCRNIDILERYGSDLLQEAIELRRAQILQGGHPDSPSPCRRAITSCITMTTSGTPLELCAKIPPDDVTGLWRTGVVRGITDSQALWEEGRKRYRQMLTLPTRASVMANAKCRSCDHAADAGVY